MRMFLCVAAGLVVNATTASAQSPPQAAPPATVTSAATLGVPPVPTPVAPPTRTAPQPIDLDELSTLNGRQGGTTAIAMSEQDLTAVNHGNTITANSVGSGQITIDRGAFEGFAGVGNFVVNSGHNNNLQGALTINIVSP